MWPIAEREGIIEAYEIPNYGSPKIYTISDINKLLKNNNINQPNAVTADQTVAQSKWKINVPSEISPSTQYLTAPVVRSQLKEKNLDSSGDKLVIKQRLDQFTNFESIDIMLLLDDNDLKNLLYEKLIPGFALKSKQKFGKKGGGKRLDLNVIEKLKEMFLAGNIEKCNKFSPEDMLKNLQKHAENNDIGVDSIPSLQQIKSWIFRFNQHHKKQAAKNANINN